LTPATLQIERLQCYQGYSYVAVLLQWLHLNNPLTAGPAGISFFEVRVNPLSHPGRIGLEKVFSNEIMQIFVVALLCIA